MNDKFGFGQLALTPPPPPLRLCCPCLASAEFFLFGDSAHVRLKAQKVGKTSMPRSPSREVRIRVAFFSVVNFSWGTLPKKRVKGRYWGT